MSATASASGAGDDEFASYERLTGSIADRVLASDFHRRWLVCFSIALSVALVFVVATYVLLTRGIGIWGVNVPVAWGYAIANYVWWIGIGMGGTFISSALLLLRQDWRCAISRAAESMTLIAVTVSGSPPKDRA